MSGPCVFDTIEARRIELVHVQIVGAVGAVGADADIDLALQHCANVGEAVSEPHVAAGIVRDRCAVIAEALHVVMVEPHAVADREVGSEQAEILQVRGLRLAVALQADHHLRLGFLHVAVQSDVEFARQRRRICA